MVACLGCQMRRSENNRGKPLLPEVQSQGLANQVAFSNLLLFGLTDVTTVGNIAGVKRVAGGSTRMKLRV